MGRVRAAAAAVAMLAVGLVAAAPAGATFHEIKIRSIFRSPAPAGAFMELQMYSPGQDLVGGHQIRVYNATATAFSGFTLPSNVANGKNQSRILVGDTAAPGSPDFTLAGLGTSLTNLAGGGAACWDVVDCVSWGSFTGDANLPSPAGTPIPGGLLSSQVSVRSITANCPTALDAADDTNNSAADFTFEVGYPVRNNSMAPTEVVCPPAPAPAKAKCKKKKKKKSSAQAAKKCKKKKKR